MALLAQVLLRNLQLDSRVTLGNVSKQRVRWFADLEIDGSVFDLDDNIVVELTVERFEKLHTRVGAIGFPVRLIQLVVDLGKEG